ncbi:phage tail tape measure protein [Gimesia sp.]|uniref:phage tail tape measure protein n=1 Tax=Gimesia sp. TaxID=2024833 RepID=UPI003A8E536B
MANKSLGNLTVNMVMNTGSFTEGAGRAERAFIRMNEQLQKQARTLDTVINKIDPFNSKLNDTVKSQEKLAKLLDDGFINGREFDVLTEQLDAVKDSVYTTNSAFAEQFREIDRTVNKLDPVIAKYAELDRMQQSLADGVRWGDLSAADFERYTQGIADMRAELDGTAEAQKQADKATQDQIRQLARLSQALDPISHELNEISKSQALLKKSLDDGLIDQSEYHKLNSALEINRTNLQKVVDGSKKATMSQKELAFAMRGLPAQFTDIAVSLQGGQNPLTVFLQQGGQLKDMFGGIGPAAKAMGGYILGLVNPFTVAASAAGVLALAYYQGSQEADEFKNALILTGNAAGTTVDDLQAMAKRIDEVSGTQRAAAQAIAQVASRAKFSAEQIELVSLAALKMESATGKAVSDTVAEFVKLADEPKKAILDLNKAQNFLTEAVYEQIVALERQGDEQNAVTLAIKAYSDTISERTGNITENLGYIEKAWKAVKEGAVEAWDSILNVGRSESETEVLDEINKKIAANEAAQKSYQAVLDKTEDPRIEQSAKEKIDTLKAQLQTLGSQRDELAKKVQLQKEEAKQQDAFNKQQAEALKAAEEIEKVHTVSLTNAEKPAKAVKDYKDNLEKIRSVNPESKLLDPERVAKDLKNIESKYKDTTKKLTDDAATKLLQSLREQESVFQAQLSTSVKLSASQQDLAKFEQQIADIKSKKTLTAEQKSLLANQETIKAQLQKNIAAEDELKLRQQIIRVQNMQASADAALSAEVEKYRDALENYGANDDTLQRLREEQAIRSDIARQIERATAENVAGKLSDEGLEEQKRVLQQSLQDRLSANQDYYAKLEELDSDWSRGALASLNNYRDEAKRTAEISQRFFTSMFSSMEDSLAQFALSGKLSFHDFTVSVLKDMARIAAQKATSEMLSGVVNLATSYFSGGTNSSLNAGSTTSGYTGSDMSAWLSSNGYSSGGYTGAGSKYEPAGIVHKGEVVWSQEDVSNAGGVGIVEALRKGIVGLSNSGLTGYATGGIVGGLGDGGSIRQDSSVVIHQQINVPDSQTNSGSSKDQQSVAKAYAESARMGAREEITKQLLPGGLIWRAQNGR